VETELTNYEKIMKFNIVIFTDGLKIAINSREGEYK